MKTTFKAITCLIFLVSAIVYTHIPVKQQEIKESIFTLHKHERMKEYMPISFNFPIDKTVWKIRNRDLMKKYWRE